jgi:hypothetical protein
MKRFIEGEDRGQGSLLPEHLDDYVAEDNPVVALPMSRIADPLRAPRRYS